MCEASVALDGSGSVTLRGQTAFKWSWQPSVQAVDSQAGLSRLTLATADLVAGTSYDVTLEVRDVLGQVATAHHMLQVSDLELPVVVLEAGGGIVTRRDRDTLVRASVRSPSCAADTARVECLWRLADRQQPDVDVAVSSDLTRPDWLRIDAGQLRSGSEYTVRCGVEGVDVGEGLGRQASDSCGGGHVWDGGGGGMAGDSDVLADHVPQRQGVGADCGDGAGE
jgi:hypothetical protein